MAQRLLKSANAKEGRKNIQVFNFPVQQLINLTVVT